MFIVSSACNPGIPDPSAVSYGSGTIQFTMKSFCSNGVCNDISVCEIVASSGERKYYVPLHGSDSVSKELVYTISLTLDVIVLLLFWTNSKAKGNGGWNSDTRYDAVRLIEDSNGLHIKLNDNTFTRFFDNGSPTSWNSALPFTMAVDCALTGTALNPTVTSTADLRRSSIKFSSSVIPYFNNGGQASGSAVLSSSNQVMTTTARGGCGFTYFVSVSSNYNKNWDDTNAIMGQHLLPVGFVWWNWKYPKCSALTAFNYFLP